MIKSCHSVQLESRSWIRSSGSADVCCGRNFVLKVCENKLIYFHVESGSLNFVYFYSVVY